jgi:hypothetical protein
MRLCGAVVWGRGCKRDRCPLQLRAQAQAHNITPPPSTQIIHVNLTQHDNDTRPAALEAGGKAAFTYEVAWSETDIEFERRFDKYLDYSFFEHRVRVVVAAVARGAGCCVCVLEVVFKEGKVGCASKPNHSSTTIQTKPKQPKPIINPITQIHWFSIANASLMVLFLVGLVAVILMRTLRRDYARYSRVCVGGACGCVGGRGCVLCALREVFSSTTVQANQQPSFSTQPKPITKKQDDGGDLEALERDLAEETGWKLVHGDVFRPPPHRMLLAACVGTGAQLGTLALATILATIGGGLFQVCVYSSVCVVVVVSALLPPSACCIIVMRPNMTQFNTAQTQHSSPNLHRSAARSSRPRSCCMR